jgi:hypothetical protein
VESSAQWIARNALTSALAGLVALLTAGATFELADALRVLPRSNAPGNGPAGGFFFVGVPTLALLVFGFVFINLAGRGASPAFAWLVAPLGGAFMLAHFYSYDDYCGGYGCRYAQEVGSGATQWAWALAGGGLLAGAITWRFVRPGLLLTSAVAILCALTVLFVPFGH